MSNKKSNKKKETIQNAVPFTNEIKFFKHKFKEMIDEMSDEDFIDLVEFLIYSSDAFEDDPLLDYEYDFKNLEDFEDFETWEDEAKEFYNINTKKKSNLKLLKNDDDDIPF